MDTDRLNKLAQTIYEAFQETLDIAEKEEGKPCSIMIGEAEGHGYVMGPGGKYLGHLRFILPQNVRLGK